MKRKHSDTLADLVEQTAEVELRGEVPEPQQPVPARISRRSLLSWALIGAGSASVAGALGGAGYLAWELIGTNIVDAREHAATVNHTEQQWKAARKDGETAQFAVPNDDSANNPRYAGQPIALMRVPRFGGDWVQPVIQGTALAELGDGVGHWVGSAMPGQVGNVSLAGHRTTHDKPFALIADLRAGDRVTLETPAMLYTYTVRSHRIVVPTDIAMFDPVPGQPGAKPTRKLLTMSSCHPEYQATHRYTVTAELTGAQSL